MSASAQKVRAARAFLRQRRMAPPLSPRTFAQSSEELGKSFSDLLRFIMHLKMGQQDQQGQMQEVVRAAAGAQ